MMYAEADVRMGREGDQPDADMGVWVLKITNFLRTSFMDGPM